MNKKTIIFFIIFSITLFLTTSILVFKNNVNSKQLESSLAIMVYDEDVGDYVSSREIPKFMKLNNEKSKCQSSTNIKNYDVVNGIISYDFDAGDRCYVYFDKAPNLELLDYELQKNAEGTYEYNLDNQLTVKATFRNNSNHNIEFISSLNLPSYLFYPAVNIINADGTYQIHIDAKTEMTFSFLFPISSTSTESSFNVSPTLVIEGHSYYYGDEGSFSLQLPNITLISDDFGPAVPLI